MAPERWQRIESLVHAARELRPSDRTAFLDSACEGDRQLRANVEALLSGDGPRLETARASDVPSFPDSPGAKLGPYEIGERLGTGGMGSVYRARDTRLGRMVAIKVLRERFSGRLEREARAIAALNHPNVCTLYDVGPNYLVMEVVEGPTLAERLQGGALPPDEALTIGRQIAEALEAAHGHGIVHRDLKPGNIKIKPDGTVKILDFGLARLLEPQGLAAAPDDGSTQTATVPGMILGTPEYMSPEQARGEGLDARTDLWSLGVVLYECLSGRRPFAGRTTVEAMAAILQREPTALDGTGAPAGLTELVGRLLTKNRDDRPVSAGEVARELARLSDAAAGRGARARRGRVAAAAGVMALATLGAAGWFVHRSTKREWARYEAIPQARALADKGDFAGANRVALQAAVYIPKEPALEHLWPEISQMVSVRTEPPGASVAWKAYSPLSAPWESLGRTPLERTRVPAGPIRIQVSLAGYKSVEVASDRVAFRSESLSSYELKLDPAGSTWSRMIHVADPARSSTALSEIRQIGEFEVDRYEVTNREFKTFVDAGGYRRREFWKVPFVKDRGTLAWEAAVTQFVDPTGRPGPATWEAGTYAPGQDDYPVGGVSWFEAAAYAEFAGKSLPAVAHWNRAANIDSIDSEYKFLLSLSNLAGSHALPVGASGAVNTRGVYDLAGNVREWCWNETGGRRAVLGGSWADRADNTATYQDNADPFDRSAINGFRCVRYASPEQALRDFGGPLTPTRWPDYHQIPPVSDAVFQLYRRLYEYEPKPLKPVVEAVDESSDLWRRERVRFQAPYGNEQILAYLFLPRQGNLPYQCAIYMLDGATLRPGSGEAIQPDSYLLRSGRAILYPVYRGTLDRYVRIPPDPISQRDLLIAFRKDLGASIDYLQTRPDIDSGRLAFMGHSMGTRFAPIILANEPRLKTAVLQAGAMRPTGAVPEADPLNFLPRVTIPVLHIAGQYDAIYPVDKAQKPFFDLLGTPAKDKRHVLVPTGHAILVPEARNTVVREVLDWLDRYLGPVAAR
jgi:predicted esterase/predicted Ser/Thr protein kinase